jgi:POT family proton-dependent oligopeptide transporter
MIKERKYPEGLFFLVFTEFWERFGYYLMIGIFTLYMMAEKKEGGFGWKNEDASDVYGTFIAAAYLTPFMGGLLADLKLGYRFSIILGGILMGIGYCMLAIPEMWAFYSALVIMVIGNGFFKPNISTLLGNLFNDPRYKHKKDTGFNIFYVGINVGAFICNFIGAIMLNKIGWGGAFISAGIGMFLGVITFIIGTKHYKHVDVRREPKPEDKPFIMLFAKVLGVGVIFATLGWFLNGTEGPNHSILSSNGTDAFFMFCIPVIFFFATIYFRSNAEEKKPLGTMFTIFIIVILFWAIFKQNGTALTIYAKNYTDRECPQAIAPAANYLGFLEKAEAKNKEVPQLDEQFRKITDEKGEPVMCTDYPSYFKNLDPEKFPDPGQPILLTTTNLSQSINPFFIIILTPLIIGFFAYLKKRGKEPTTATKIAFGLLISALSTLVMVAAVHYSNNGMYKASYWWLIASYGVVTIGELCLSPMGLSMVSKLSPTRLTALMMGGWSLATSIGNKVSGELAKNWDKFDHKANYFWVNFALLMAATILIFALLKNLNKVFKERAV